jgi:hypothetical protein
VQRARLAAAAAALVIAADVAVLVTGAASSDDDIDTATATTSAAAATSTVAVTTADGATTRVVDGVSGSTTALPGPGDGSTTTTAGSTPGDPPDDTRSLPVPGRYDERVTGTVNGQPAPPSQTLVVEQLSATDQRHVVERDDGRSEQVLRDAGAEVLLVSIDLGVKQFVAEPPVRFTPVPLEVGQTWGWDLTSTDGATHLRQDSRVSRTEQVTVAGTAVDTFVVETVLVLSGDLDGTIAITSWASPRHGIAVRTHQVSDVRFGLVRFTADTVSELTSLTPA